MLARLSTPASASGISSSIGDGDPRHSARLSGREEDGRDEDGISPEGALPPGDDLIEDDLRQLFSLEAEDGMLDGTEMDDLQLMWKLRKELGDEDFARIFEDPKVKGPDVK